MKNSLLFLTLPLFALVACPTSTDIQAEVHQETLSIQPEQPNFVFIAIDDLNDWVGYMGGHPQAQTPNMDQLAKQGVAFTNAHSVAPGCSPSRNALMYGTEPYNSGLYPYYEHDIYVQLKKQYTSLPKLLKDNGYNTYGAGKIHHGNEHGETEWTDYLEPRRYPVQFAQGRGFRISRKLSFRPVTNPLEEMFDHAVASYGIDIIEQEHEKPYFAAIGLIKPHLPFNCPIQFYDALPDTITPPAIIANDLDDIGPEGNSMRRASDVKKFKVDNRWNEVRKAYLACVSWVDHNVGRILDAVKNSPEANNTVVVLWSDNGFHFGEKQTFRKFTLWEEALRVPFIIYDARQAAQTSREVNQGITLINVYRTIADLAGIKPPDYVDGFSLVPQLQDQTVPVAKPAISSWGRGNYSVRTKDWRLIRYFDGKQELYHSREDQQEWHNLANKPEHQGKLKELSEMLPIAEVATVENYISNWGIFGADKQRLKKRQR